MTPTVELRVKLRRLLDERIPEGGADTDTRFSDAEIDELFREARSVYQAASIGWAQKAAMFQGEMAGIEEASAGQERYRFTALKDRLEYALRMAETYAEMDGRGSAVLLRVAKPQVM